VGALVGLAISAVVHVMAYTGGGPSLFLVLPLHIGLFVPFGAGVIGLGTGNPGVGGAAAWRMVARHTPAWAFLGVVGLLFYAFANFFISMSLMQGGSPQEAEGRYVLADRGHVLREITAEEFTRLRSYETRLFSGHWLAFYAAGAVMNCALWRERRHPDGDASWAPEQPVSAGGAAADGRTEPEGEPGSMARLETRFPPSWPLQRVLMVPGLIGNLVFAWFAYTWIAPAAGPGGFIFLGALALITLINVARLVFWKTGRR
jgi:hypothetical protein